MEIDYYSYSFVPLTVDNFILAVAQPMPFAPPPPPHHRISAFGICMWADTSARRSIRAERCFLTPREILSRARITAAPRSFTSIHCEMLFSRNRHPATRVRYALGFPSLRAKLNARTHFARIRFTRIRTCSTNARLCAPVTGRRANVQPCTCRQIYNGWRIRHAMYNTYAPLHDSSGLQHACARARVRTSVGVVSVRACVRA